MKEFAGEKEDFVGDWRLVWEPVKVDEIGDDELPGLGASENPGSFCTYWILSRALLATPYRT